MFFLLGYNAVQSLESQLTFQRIMSPPTSGLKDQPRNIPARSRQQATELSLLLVIIIIISTFCKLKMNQKILCNNANKNVL
jgi:hypothetical protein